jgi:Gas vesicle synthesis protein GvpL/GvpF
MTNSLYLYGIFPAAMPDLQLEGLDKQPVQRQEIDGFTFLYSEAQQGQYLASRKNLLGHERVLEQAMQQGYRTLLPLQFGLVITDWETVHQQLILPKGETLKQLFCKLEGHREVGVKVLWESDRELEALLEENDSLRSERDRLEGKALSMDQIVKIGQAIEQEMSDRKQAIISVFQGKLDPIALETIENDLLTEAMIYNAAYLIQWDSETEFGAQVEQLDRHFDQRLRIRYNNFTAPFNFVQI